jgi:hypothetical protein
MSPSRGAAAVRVSEAVSVFAALADPTRLRLLGRLSAARRGRERNLRAVG